MTSEAQVKTQKFLYHLSTENYAEADKQLKDIIKDKVDSRFNDALEKVKTYFSKQK